jgi:uncharacterized protein YneF (UPF0154 family)
MVFLFFIVAILVLGVVLLIMLIGGVITLFLERRTLRKQNKLRVDGIR